VLDVLLKLKNPAVLCHSHADVDAVCSGLIIANKLNCKLFIPDYIIHHAQRIINKIIPRSAQNIEIGKLPNNHSDIIVVDANSPDMVGIEKCKVIIDHHVNPKIEADYYFINTNASSTCEIIAREIKLEGWETVAAAAGILDDTNILRFISPHTLQILQLLISYEQYNRLVYMLTQHYSSVGERVNIIKSLKNSKTVVESGKVILIVNSNSFDPNIAEGLNEIADIVIMFKEKSNGVQVMLRSGNSPVNCANILHSFEVYNCTAGGHMHAASMFCPLMGTEIVTEVEQKIKYILKSQEIR